MSSGSPSLQRAFEQAQQQAQDVAKHGKAFQRIAHSLGKRLLTREQVETMEYTGQQIQQHGYIMKALVEIALQNERYSLETYALIHRHQCQAVLLYIKATKVLLQGIRSLL